MDLIKGVHGAADIITFLSYSVISYGVYKFVNKRPRYRDLLRLFAAFICLCGLTHLSHVLFNPSVLDMEAVVAISTAITASISAWTAFVLTPLFPKIASSATQEEIEDLIVLRTEELQKEILARKQIEHDLTVVMGYRKALSEISKAVVLIHDKFELVNAVGDLLKKHGKSNSVQIACWENDESKILYQIGDACKDCHNKVIEEIPFVQHTNGCVRALFRMHTRTQSYTVCTSYPKMQEPYGTDYLELLTEIVADFEYALRKLEDSTVLCRMELEKCDIQNQLDYISTHDYVTDLPNKDYVEHLVSALIDKTTDNLLCVSIIELAKFKQIAAAEGHDFSDLLLKKVAKLFKASGVSILGRLGTDEFLVVAEVETRSEIESIMHFFLSCLDNPIDVNGKHCKLKLNAGIAIYPNDGSSYDQLLRCASIALTAAKDLGANKISFYGDRESLDTDKRLRLELLLDRDIRDNKVDVAYQPQVDMRTGEIIGVEVLARWACEELGPVSASVFLQVAEDTGSITNLGLLVLEKACKQWREWVDNGMRPIKLSVNASALQMHDCQILEPLMTVLAKYSIPHEYFKLELTETVLVVDASNVEGCISSIRDEGIEVSIDDFGTGYSSLSYLNNLKTDELKIDQSFVADIAKTGNTIIVRSILRLAEDLQLSTIAEGVETEQQRDILLELGCHYAQGYFYHKPMTATDLYNIVTHERQPAA